MDTQSIQRTYTKDIHKEQTEMTDISKRREGQAQVLDRKNLCTDHKQQKPTRRTDTENVYTEHLHRTDADNNQKGEYREHT